MRLLKVKHIGVIDINTNINGSIIFCIVRHSSFLNNSSRPGGLPNLECLLSPISTVVDMLTYVVGHLSIRGAKMSKSLKNCQC